MSDITQDVGDEAVDGSFFHLVHQTRIDCAEVDHDNKHSAYNPLPEPHVRCYRPRSQSVESRGDSGPASPDQWFDAFRASHTLKTPTRIGSLSGCKIFITTLGLRMGSSFSH
jgi:hypothetical protein